MERIQTKLAFGTRRFGAIKWLVLLLPLLLLLTGCDSISLAGTLPPFPFNSPPESNVGAGLEAGEPTPCGGIASTVWAKYTATSTQQLGIDTIGSDFPTVVAVYSGVPPYGFGDLTLLGCDVGRFGLGSGISFNVTSGTTYYFQFGGAGGAQGTLVVNGTIPITTLTVNSSDDVDDTTCDATHCSLREAINASNDMLGVQTIDFNISGSGVHTIAPTSLLPTVTDPAILDATSQPGYAAGTPVIELDGTGAGSSASGLTVTAGGTTIKGFIINRFSSGGGIVLNSDGNVVTGNFIGTNATGTAAGPGDGGGIIISGSNNTIGDGTAGGRNVISGNFVGIYINPNGGTANSNNVDGNYIGTDEAGTAPIANGAGVYISTGSGGFAVNNNIGTDPGAGNVISGNTTGVLLSGSVGTGVRNNKIGTDAAGTGSMPNSSDGISISGGSGATVYRNTIANNGGKGVDVLTSSTGIWIGQNSIYNNGGLGIDLGNDGVTLNDPGDGDTGPNNLQNYPLLTSATSAATTTVSGSLDSTPGSIFYIHFYSSPACDVLGNGEGQTYIGVAVAITDGSGNVSFTASGLDAVSPGQVVTATAQSTSSDTSEFSACQTVTSGCTDTDGDTICDTSDNCPAVSNVAQTNSDGDTLGNSCDNCQTTTNQNQANTDGDEYGDACEQPQCVTVINHWAVPSGDSDCDGWTDVRETFSGTLTAQKCMTTSAANDESGTDAWPVDYNDDQLSNGQDILKYNPKFGAVAPGGPAANQYSVRFDLNADGIINGQDILKHNPYFGKFCSP